MCAETQTEFRPSDEVLVSGQLERDPTSGLFFLLSDGWGHAACLLGVSGMIGSSYNCMCLKIPMASLSPSPVQGPAAPSSDLSVTEGSSA